MFTEFEQDERNVYSFIARFGKLSTCQNDCTESLVIKIRDIREAQSAEDIVIVASLSIGAYDLGFTNDLDFSDVFIEYTDPTGKVFQSGLIEQDGESSFEVLSVTDFADNEDGYPTKKLETSFNCRLKNIESEEELTFSDVKATIGVAFPK